MLPAKPSQTRTLVSPKVTSLGSTLPTKLSPSSFFSSWYVFLVNSLPFSSSAPILTNPILGFSAFNTPL